MQKKLTITVDETICRKAMADQLTTASKQRLIRKAGAISREDLGAVERAVRVQLGLAS